jgi:hypothetical protein
MTRRASTAWPIRTSSTPPTMPSRLKTLEKTPTGGCSSGSDLAGNLLEVVVLITAEGTQIVIHAMPMRDKYARLLDS